MLYMNIINVNVSYFALKVYDKMPK